MNHQARNDDVHQEEDRLPWRRILLVAIATLGISAMLVLGSWIVLRDRRGTLRPSGQFPEAELTLGRESSVIPRELFNLGRGPSFAAPSKEDQEWAGPGQRIQAAKRRELSSFSWADRDHRLVNIPIEEGMRLIIEESKP